MTVVPGLLVASIIGMRLRTMTTWAVVPAFSLAAVFLLGEATWLLHAPFGLPAFVALVVLLGAGAAAMRVIRGRGFEGRRASGESRPADPPDTGLAARIDYVLLGLAVAVGGITWFRGLRGVPLIPPGTDANRHGWFIARIMFSHTIDPSKVVSSDIAGKHPAANFYPLALHASAALATRLGGSDVGRVLVAYVVIFSAVVLPVGMFALARMLAPTRPLVAGFTALVVPLLALFPYFPIHVGDVPQIVAMALVPVTVVVLVQSALTKRPSGRISRATIVTLVPATLAILCIASTHSGELPLIVLLPLLLVLEAAWRERDRRMLGIALVRGAAAAGLATLLYAPTIVSFARGVSERSAIRGFFPTLAWRSELAAIFGLSYTGTARQSVVAGLALAGAVIWLASKRPAWVIGWIGVAFLAVLANDLPNRFAETLTLPWYHLDVRIVPNIAFFVPFFAGLTLSGGAALISRVPTRRQVPVNIPAALVMVIVLAALAGVEGVRSNSNYIRNTFTPNTRLIANEAVVGFSTLAAFQWLHDHVTPGDTVANEPNDNGSLWMYAQQHVSPLVGPYDTLSSKELADRVYLTNHLQLLGHDARADAIARRYQTHWVFFDNYQFLLGAYSAMKLPALQRNPALSPAFHDGGTWIFRINPSG